MSTWTYDRSTQTYKRKDTGQVVGPADTRRLLEEWTKHHRTRLQDAARRLTTGKVSLEEWRTETATALREYRLCAKLLKTGGRRAMRPSDWQDLRQALHRDEARLTNLVAEVQTGRIARLDLAARAVELLEQTWVPLTRRPGPDRGG